MNTYRYTPKKVVEDNLSFSIPLYQRLFSWGTDQVYGLLSDLKNHFKSREGQKSDSPYYLGMLSCIGSNGRYDLIDGQQRFTVMTLFAVVLRKDYDAWKDFLIDRQQLRLHFIARTKDNDYLKAIIDKSSPIENVNIKMAEGIKCISSFMDSAFDTEEERKEFAKNVYERMSFFFSKLPDSYSHNPSSLNKYFEAMNASGKGLEQHEILKVQLMRGEENKEYLTRIWNAVCDLNQPLVKRSENDTAEEYRSKYETAIEYCRKGQYNQAFSSRESSYDSEDINEIGSIMAKKQDFTISFNKTGEKSIIIFPEFLMMVLDLYLNINIDTDHSYSFYRKELLNVFNENPISDKQDFYNQLLFYRLLFDYYIIYKEGEEGENRYDIVYKAGEKTEALKQYQSMLYVSQTPFYNWLKPVLSKLHSEPIQDSESLLSLIKDIDNSLHKLPANIAEMSYKNGVNRYWFWRLDYYLWERRDEYFNNDEERQIVNDYVFRANRSIEHLHPQHQANNDEWKIEDIHSFGNLAMISQSFNSQQSDDPVIVKFARIKEQAHNHTLQSIKMYRMYLDAEETSSGWNIEKKKTHQEKMYELLVKSYEKNTD